MENSGNTVEWMIQRKMNGYMDEWMDGRRQRMTKHRQIEEDKTDWDMWRKFRIDWSKTIAEWIIVEWTYWNWIICDLNVGEIGDFIQQWKFALNWHYNCK